MCYNRQDCWHQESKKSGIDLDLHGSGASGSACSWFWFLVGVITLDGRFTLRSNHLNKGLTKLDHGFGADEKARNFGFGSRGHNKLDYLGDSENRAISGKSRGVL